VPYLKVQSNQDIKALQQTALMKDASTLIATELGKPENYVMVTIDPVRPMLFAGTEEPTAYLELKSIGLAESQTKSLSAALCQLIHEKINIAQDRIYIEFTDAPRSMWGWNGSTF